MTTVSNGLEVTSISIKNAYGLKQAVIKPGNVTVLSGRNGEGKTSVLKALESVFKGGRDPSLLNTDSESGEIIVALSDDTKISKSFDKSKYSLSVVREGKKITSPQTFLNELTSSMGCNPLVLLTASKQERTKYFLETLPVDVDLDTLADISGADVDEDGHGMVIIDSVYQELYAQRRAANRDVDRLTKTIQSGQGLVDSFEPEALVELESEIEGLKMQRQALDEDRKTEVGAIEQKYDLKIQKLDKELTESTLSCDHVDREYDSKIQNVKHQLEIQISKLKEAARDDIEKINSKREAAKQKDAKVLANHPHQIELIEQKKQSLIKDSLNKFDKEGMTIDGQLTNLERDLKEAGKAEPILEQLCCQRKELDALRSEVGDFNERMQRVLDYKRQLLEDLKIDWFDYRDKQVYIDGVEFEGVNTARLVQVAIELAKLQSPRLKLLCLDGIESLDDTNFNLLVKEAIKSGMNIIVTKVSDDERVKVQSMFGNDPADLDSRVAYAN